MTKQKTRSLEGNRQGTATSFASAPPRACKARGSAESELKSITIAAASSFSVGRVQKKHLRSASWKLRRHQLAETTCLVYHRLLKAMYSLYFGIKRGRQRECHANEGEKKGIYFPFSFSSKNSVDPLSLAQLQVQAVVLRLTSLCRKL
jgi:hypothetical protein